MDLILSFLLLVVLVLSNVLITKKRKQYNKIKNIIYVILFIFIIVLILCYFKNSKQLKGGGPRKEHFNQNKISKLKKMCGIPINDRSTRHCFADGTHQTCCLLGPEAREYADGSGNGIGKLSVDSFKKFKKQQEQGGFDKKDTSAWCTCLGSRVCSYYAKKFNDGTKIKFINDRNTDEIADNPPARCEAYYGDKFLTDPHSTPGINEIQKKNSNCANLDNKIIRKI